MLRITTTTIGETSVIKLEGKLLEPWLDAVNSTFEQTQKSFQKIHLDLASVSFADERGVRLIRRFVQAGACIDACSHYVAQLLKLETL